MATHEAAYYRALIESCTRHSVKLDVLGWGQPWKGFSWRMELLIEYLGDCDSDEVVCFIDAYDVVLLRPLQDLESQFRSHVAQGGAAIVISSEKRGWYDFILRICFDTCQGVPINAGTYIGLAGALRDMLAKICDNGACKVPEADDQRLVTQFCAANSRKVAIDTNFDWFLVWGLLDSHVGDEIAISSSGSLTFEKHRQPFILHCPGNKDMTNVLKRLGYNGNWSATQRGLMYFPKVIWYHTKHVLRNRMLEITVFSILLLALVRFAPIMKRKIGA